MVYYYGIHATASQKVDDDMSVSNCPYFGQFVSDFVHVLLFFLSRLAFPQICSLFHSDCPYFLKNFPDFWTIVHDSFRCPYFVQSVHICAYFIQCVLMFPNLSLSCITYIYFEVNYHNPSSRDIEIMTKYVPFD